MNFEHETASGVRSKATGMLYPHVQAMVDVEGPKLLAAIVEAAGIEASTTEIRALWAAQEDLLALLLRAREAIESIPAAPPPPPDWLESLRRHDAPFRTAWECPDCPAASTLGCNAADHARVHQHGAPHLVPAPGGGGEPATLEVLAREFGWDGSGTVAGFLRQELEGYRALLDNPKEP